MTSTYKYIFGRKRKHQLSDCGSEADEDDILDIIKKMRPDAGGAGSASSFLFGNHNETVFRRDNHLYFYDSVTGATCLKFTTLLREIDQEQQIKVVKDDVDIGKIHIHINSYGGSLLDGFSMASSVMSCKSHTISYVEGVCASAATLPFVCSNERNMQRYCYFLMHQLSSSHWGTHENFKDELQNQDEFMDQIKKIYVSHTNVNPDKLDKLLKHDLFWNAKKCKKYGIVTDII